MSLAHALTSFSCLCGGLNALRGASADPSDFCGISDKRKCIARARNYRISLTRMRTRESAVLCTHACQKKTRSSSSFFQDCGSGLTTKIVHEHQGLLQWDTYGLSCLPDLLKDDVFKKTKASFFICPVTWGMENVKSLWESILWDVNALSFAGTKFALARKCHPDKQRM